MKTISLFRSLFFLIIFSAALTGCSAEPEYPVVEIITDFGVIEVELYDDRAPVTVANFFRYVDNGLYENGIFHRVVNHDNDPRQPVHKINVIQGSRMRDPDSPDFPPIELERTSITGILHKHGVISMARGGPDTATSSFFICINDQPSLDYEGQRNRDGQGFAAFGNVTEGMDIVMEIYSQPYEEQRFDPPVDIQNIVRKQ